MNAAIVVMTILGCSQGEVSCEYIRTVEASYDSRAQCEAQAERQLLRTGQDNYPEVIALCEPLDTVVTGPRPADRPDMRAADAGPVLQAGEARPLPGASRTHEPRVIYSEFDEDKPRNVVRRVFRRTGEMIAGAGHALASSLRKLGGASRRDAGPQGTDPIVLSRYAGEES